MHQDIPREGDPRANDRRELLEMLKALTPGDPVTVARIGRPARNTFDLFGIVKRQGTASILGRTAGRHRPSTSRLMVRDSAGWPMSSAI